MLHEPITPAETLARRYSWRELRNRRDYHERIRREMVRLDAPHEMIDRERDIILETEVAMDLVNPPTRKEQP